jgi:hypothetical protein
MNRQRHGKLCSVSCSRNSDYPKPDQPDCQLSGSKSDESILNFVSVLQSDDGSTTRKTKTPPESGMKLPFINGLCTNGQLNSLFQGRFCVKKKSLNV